MLRHQESLQGRTGHTTGAMALTSFTEARLTLDLPRTVMLWCSVVPILFPIARRMDL